ncbi:MAG TPA: CDP-alcohol phosphatidyltransferase family protein [Candidatus Acidoferrales bacterium]|nr:CDP-alcohol phosphatidyltransferase family protein [Candidatus Acidoferrales bacterium]
MGDQEVEAIGPLATMGRLFTGAADRWVGSRSLRVSMTLWSGLGLVLTLGAGASAGMLAGRLWLGLACGAVWWVATTACLFAGISLLLRYPDQTPIDSFGVPNGITAIRAYLSLPVVLYAVLPPLGLARVLFLVIAAPIAALDSADGYIARRAGPLTVLGRAIDPIMDTVFFSLCTVACLLVGFMPLWLAVLVLARYGLPGVGFLLLYPWLRRRPAMVATRFGKINTVATAVTIGVSSLLVLAGRPAWQTDIALGAVLAATALGHFVTLWRRTFPTTLSESSPSVDAGA